MWECKLGTHKPCLRAAPSGSTGLAHWEHVHSILYGLWSLWLLLLGTSGVTMQGTMHRQSQRKRNIKTKLTFFLMSSKNQSAPCCHCDLCSSWGDPSSRGLGPGFSEEQTKSFLVWVLPVHAPRYNILCSHWGPYCALNVSHFLWSPLFFLCTWCSPG